MNTKTLRLIVALGGLTVLAGCGGQDAAPPAPPPPAQQANAAANPRQQSKAIEPAEPVGEAPFDLSYLAQDTELFVFARPAAILASPFVQSLAGGRLDDVDVMREQIGIGFDQMETITIGIRGLQELSQKGQAQFAQWQASMAGGGGNGAPPPVDSTENTVVVLRTNEAVSIDDLKLPPAEEDGGGERTHASKSYYRLSGPTGEEGFLYPANPTTLIFGSETAIRQIIDQGEKPASPPVNLGFIPEAADVILAVVPRDRQAFWQSFQFATPGASASAAPSVPFGPMGNGPLMGVGDRDEDEYEDEDEDEDRRRFGGGTSRRQAQANAPAPQTADESSGGPVKAGALLVNVDADLRLEVLVHCASPQAAAELHTAAEEAIKSATQAFEDVRNMLPGVLQEMGQAVLDTVESRADRAVVSISAAFPESQQANLSVLPMAIMGMMMSGSLAPDAIGPLVDWQGRAREVLTQGQPPVSAEGLPAGAELRALARWGIPAAGDPQAPAPLEVAIVASGPPGALVVAFGQLKLTQLEAGEGARLKWLGAAHTTGPENPVREFVSVDRETFIPRHPPEGIATGYTFSMSGDAPPALPVLAGHLTLKVARGSHDVMIDSVRAAIQSINDPTLKELNFAVRSTADALDPQLVFTYKESPAIRRIDVLGADGRPVGEVGPGIPAAAGQIRRTISLPPRADLQSLKLRISVYDDLREVPIAFRFEGLPLPEPQPSTLQQQALLAWTPAKLTSDLPDDLTVEAQARWPSQQPSPGAGSLPFAGGSFPAFSPPGRPASAGVAGGLPGRFLIGSRDEDDRPAGLSGRRRDEDDDESAGGAYDAGFDDSLLESGLPATSSSFSPTDANKMLQLAVDLTGPLAEATIAVGELSVESAVSERGNELAFHAGLFNGQNVTGGWYEIDEDSPPVLDQPPNGWRVVYLFAPPEPPIEQIGEFRGAMKLRTSLDMTEAIVRNLNNRTNRRIKDRTLTKFGIEIAVAIDGNVLKYRQLEGDETRIADLFPVDQNGVPIEGVTHTTVMENENLIHYFDFARPVPQRVGLKFLINVGVREVNVPLRFNNVPVPVALSVER